MFGILLAPVIGYAATYIGVAVVLGTPIKILETAADTIHAAANIALREYSREEVLHNLHESIKRYPDQAMEFAITYMSNTLGASDCWTHSNLIRDLVTRESVTNLSKLSDDFTQNTASFLREPAFIKLVADEQLWSKIHTNIPRLVALMPSTQKLNDLLDRSTSSAAHSATIPIQSFIPLLPEITHRKYILYTTAHILYAARDNFTTFFRRSSAVHKLLQDFFNIPENRELTSYENTLLTTSFDTILDFLLATSNLNTHTYVTSLLEDRSSTRLPVLDHVLFNARNFLLEPYIRKSETQEWLHTKLNIPTESEQMRQLNMLLQHIADSFVDFLIASNHQLSQNSRTNAGVTTLHTLPNLAQILNNIKTPLTEYLVEIPTFRTLLNNYLGTPTDNTYTPQTKLLVKNILDSTQFFLEASSNPTIEPEPREIPHQDFYTTTTQTNPTPSLPNQNLLLTSYALTQLIDNRISVQYLLKQVPSIRTFVQYTEPDYHSTSSKIKHELFWGIMYFAALVAGAYSMGANKKSIIDTATSALAPYAIKRILTPTIWHDYSKDMSDSKSIPDFIWKFKTGIIMDVGLTLIQHTALYSMCGESFCLQNIKITTTTAIAISALQYSTAYISQNPSTYSYTAWAIPLITGTFTTYHLLDKSFITSDSSGIVRKLQTINGIFNLVSIFAITHQLTSLLMKPLDQTFVNFEDKISSWLFGDKDIDSSFQNVEYSTEKIESSIDELTQLTTKHYNVIPIAGESIDNCYDIETITN